MPSNPNVTHVILCDQVIIDQVTNKKSLIGLFDAIQSAEYPFTQPSMCVFISVTGGRGATDGRLVIQHENPLNESPPIAELKGKFNFQDPNSVVQLAFTLHKVKFEQAGNYLIKLLSDEEIIAQRTFHVIDPNTSEAQ